MLIWQKSTFSGGGDGDHCIEVADTPWPGLALREGDDPGEVLAAQPTRVAGLIRHLKDDRRRAPHRG